MTILISVSPILQAPSTAVASVPSSVDSSIKETLLKKQKELLELQHKKLELELLQTKARLMEQQRQLEQQNVVAVAKPAQEAVKEVKV